VLTVAGLAVFLSGPAQTYGVSAFVDPMLNDLGLSRSLFSTIYSIGTLASAGALLLVGRQIDRVGNRLVMALAAVGFTIALLILSMVTGPILLLIGFSLLRSCGSGILTLGSRTLVPHWFVRNRGRAFSLIGLAGTLSLAIVPPVNNLLINAIGWQTAWRIQALVMGLVLLPAIILVIRDRPEDIGQRADGEPVATEGSASAAAPEEGLTLRQAWRLPAFWGLLGAGLVPSLVVTGLSFNQVAIFVERGLPSTLAATTFTVEAAVGLPVTLLAGWLLDRYPVRYTLAAGQVFMAVAMIWLLMTATPELALLYSALRGISGGLWMVAVDVAWPAYFGRRYLGSIRGFGFATGVAGAALGPIIFGLAYDNLGGYNAAILGLLALPVVAAIAVLLTRPPALGGPPVRVMTPQ
jgi:MFS family permease